MSELSTRAIVLRMHPYSDRYSILHCYCQDCGRQNFLLPSTKPSRRKSPRMAQLVSPLAEIELLYQQRPQRDLQRIDQLSLFRPRLQLQCDQIKQSIVIYLSEFLSHILRNQEPETLLYEFLSHSIDQLDECKQSAANFHIAFLLQLLRHLGIQPDLAPDFGAKVLYFDLLESRYTDVAPLHAYTVPTQGLRFMQLLARMSYDNMHRFRLTRLQRRQILAYIETYYRLHLPDFPSLRSPQTLAALFDE